MNAINRNRSLRYYLRIVLLLMFTFPLVSNPIYAAPVTQSQCGEGLDDACFVRIPFVTHAVQSQWTRSQCEGGQDDGCVIQIALGGEVRNAQVVSPALIVHITHVDNQLAIYLNGEKVYDKFAGGEGTDVSDSVVLTGLLRPGRNTLLFVGANTGGPWQFGARIELAESVVAFYDRRGGDDVGIVWEAGVLVDVEEP